MWKLDVGDEKYINNDYISLDEVGFEFVNVDEDEWIDNLQVDVMSNNSDEDNINIEKGKIYESSNDG
jgi:hypothetical protein